jgi:glucose/arabinose dehydrogenase
VSKPITFRRTAPASARHALWMAPVLAAVFINGLTSTRAEDDYIPRAQDRPPGPALSPAEAIQQMTVPEGFHVEVFASEPDIVNPVAMAFDEQGRVWITESFEYPRREPGPGRDRVKCLEDTDGDGRCDKVTVFAEGLNIPCGIAVGYGGVWISNAPDILFLQDTDGDG